MRRSRRCERRSTPIRPDGGSAAGMRASPKCRPTSSARSASPTTSSRHDGTRAVVSSPASFSWKPSAVSVSTCCFGSTATPSSAFTRAGRWRTLRAGRSPSRRSTSPGAHATRADLRGQVREAVERLRAGCDVGAALEAVRGLRVHAERPGRPPDGERLPPGGLERDECRGVVDLARRAAHDPGERERGLAALAGDHADAPRQRALLAVERRQRLARARPAHDERVARHARQVEGVARLAELDHHVVREVDDVVDRPDADQLEPVAQPRRRRADRHVEQARAEAAAQLGSLDPDVEGLVGPGARGEPPWCRASAAAARRAPPPRAPRRRRSCSRRGSW